MVILTHQAIACWLCLLSCVSNDLLQTNLYLYYYSWPKISLSNWVFKNSCGYEDYCWYRLSYWWISFTNTPHGRRKKFWNPWRIWLFCFTCHERDPGAKLRRGGWVSLGGAEEEETDTQHPGWVGRDTGWVRELTSGSPDLLWPWN